MKINNVNEKVNILERLVNIGQHFSKWVESWKYSGFIKLFVGWLFIILLIVTVILTFYCYSMMKRGFNLSPEQISVYKKTTEQATLNSIEKTKRLEAEKDSAVYALSNKIELSVNERVLSLLNKLDADRVTITIFHDTEKSAPHLHFRFFSECYEHVNYDRHIPEIAGEYQKVKTSLFPMFSYLSINQSVFAPVKDYENIDIKYAHRLMENNYGWVGLRFLRTKSGAEIGVLTVTWLSRNMKYKPSDDKIKYQMEKTSLQLESLFDINNPSYELSKYGSE